MRDYDFTENAFQELIEDINAEWLKIDEQITQSTLTKKEEEYLAGKLQGLQTAKRIAGKYRSSAYRRAYR